MNCNICKEENFNELNYCKECFEKRIIEIFTQKAPNQNEFVYEMWLRFLTSNYWNLKSFLDEYDK